MLLTYLFSGLFRQSLRFYPHNDENNHYATAFFMMKQNFVIFLSLPPCFILSKREVIYYYLFTKGHDIEISAFAHKYVL